jgi:RNA-directed DNA polymerase
MSRKATSRGTGGGEQFIDTLQAELKARTFRPEPVRRVEIPKPGTHKTRKLGIPTIKDRVVQTLLKMVLEPIWEADFLYFSNGFRPRRCTMDGIQPLYTLFNRHMQYTWVIEGDIRACFDTIPHQRLLVEVARRVADRRVLALIQRFLKSGVMVGLELVPSEEGTPQGGIVSPLLANIYLHRFDAWFVEQYTCPPGTSKEAWRRERVKGGTKAAAQMFRYADDWIILVRGTKSQARDRKRALQAVSPGRIGTGTERRENRNHPYHGGIRFPGVSHLQKHPPERQAIGGDLCTSR